MLYLISFIASVGYTTSSDRVSFGAQNAYYDFSNILYKNATIGRCLIRDNTTCIERLLSIINGVYGFEGSKIVYGNISVKQGREYLCGSISESCYPFNGIKQSVCLYICGG